MALVTCPECGKEHVSDGASACPNCGFDLKSYFQEKERQQLEYQKQLQAQENLRMQQQYAEQEHQRILSEIKDPTIYGKIQVYIIIAAIGLLLALTGSFLTWILLTLISCGIYFGISYSKYNKFAKDPYAYKEEIYRQKMAAQQQASTANVQTPRTVNGKLFCPVCGSEDIEQQVFQENRGSQTITQTSSKYKEKGHGCLWWLLIGWWWWAVDLFLWIFAFVPRLIIRLFAAPFKHKKYKGSETSVSKTINDISYRTVCKCRNCGHTW